MEKYLCSVLQGPQFTALLLDKVPGIMLIMHHALHSVWFGQQRSEGPIFSACSA